jgi:phosphatidate cytidylyltransferase
MFDPENPAISRVPGRLMESLNSSRLKNKSVHAAGLAFEAWFGKPHTNPMGAALKTFLARSLSTLSLWGVCAAAMYWAYEPGLRLLVGGLILSGLVEFYSMLASAGFPHFRRTGLFLGTALTAGALALGSSKGADAAFIFETAALLVAVLWVFVRQIFHRNPDTNPAAAVGYTLLGLIYIPFLAASTINLLYLTPRAADGHLTGHYYLLFLAVVTKMSDCGAYLTGSLIGRHPMIPRISPKKTWEGFAGALAHSVIAAVVLVKVLPNQLSLIASPLHAAIIGLVLGFVAVLGDLAESLIKRSTHTKDSGSILPGIGGAMDLIDSLLFTGPLLYLYLRYTTAF